MLLVKIKVKIKEVCGTFPESLVLNSFTDFKKYSENPLINTVSSSVNISKYLMNITLDSYRQFSLGIFGKIDFKSGIDVF